MDIGRLLPGQSIRRGPLVQSPSDFLVRLNLSGVDGSAAAERLFTDVQVVLDVLDRAIVGQRFDELDDFSFEVLTAIFWANDAFCHTLKL